MTEHGGLGHTSAVYAEDPAVVERFGDAIRTGRILVNAPTAVGALGGVYNELAPTFSLGCGTWGGSTTTRTSTTASCSTSRSSPVASRRRSGSGCPRRRTSTRARSVCCVRSAAARVLLVTDADTRGARRGRRGATTLAPAAVRVFSDVEPEPDEAAIRAGAERLAAMEADLVVAVGGGSVIDAAKVMRLLSEHPELTRRRAGAAVPGLRASGSRASRRIRTAPG